MAHVRKGDMVVVIRGAYKGKRGKILRLVGDRVIVEKVAMIKRHQKPTQKTPQGGIIDKEGTIHISNVALYDDKLGRGTRTKSMVEGDTKVRVGVKSGTKFPNTGMV
ncbi:MAG TPA: 50S ribosomal protein L24 [Kofleriaceae bacterium]|nr:50S ribosomal protein L24 [Kofleriaceae bacterium]